MKDKALQVKFLKGAGELEGPFGGSSYIHRTADGDAFLKAAESGGPSTRYHFHQGDIGGSFPSEESRKRYMDKINTAAGETVVVPAEAA
ncbi:hypothetical protein J8F10_09235 [Gemmata sp. G18]|uniref:Uncharacterized protein n=1 Tax=Gemmata palustris TaxID=2822762 RepID=A0ABS5BP11_9BACT|nr:hypothetical protein [Gemmata palustris]MBP3955464.1 hypothetical protein [Gemmata palustris]